MAYRLGNIINLNFGDQFQYELLLFFFNQDIKSTLVKNLTFIQNYNTEHQNNKQTKLHNPLYKLIL